MTTTTTLTQLARAICTAAGEDPDAEAPALNASDFADHAAAALAVMTGSNGSSLCDDAFAQAFDDAFAVRLTTDTEREHLQRSLYTFLTQARPLV